jgi:hypothetical protein
MNTVIVILLAIVINGHRLTISPVLPYTAQAAMLVEYQDKDFLLAHNYLAGHLFYDLSAGDKVTAVYQGYTRQYIVSAVTIQPYMPIYISDVRGSAYLVTCWPEQGRATGRLLVELKEAR